MTKPISEQLRNHGTLPAIIDHTRKALPKKYVPSPTDFTEMQRRFCEEYLLDLDPEKAAVRAGYPPGEAKRAGPAVLKHPPARDHILRLQAQRSVRVGVNAERVLNLLGGIFNADPGACFRPDGSIMPIGEMPVENRMLIQSLKVKRALGIGPNGDKVPEEITEVRFTPKETVGALLMRHLGMMNDKVTVEHTSLADRLREAQARRAGLIDRPVMEGELVDDDALAETPGMAEWSADAIEAVAELELDPFDLDAALAEVLGD